MRIDNIIIPMAGLGTRFSNAGYLDPKPFIKIKDKYIVEYAISSLGFNDSKHVLIVRKALNEKYKSILMKIFDKYQINGDIVCIDKLTSGAAETCMLVAGQLSGSLVITNCDQYTPWNPTAFCDFLDKNNPDGVVTTYNHPGEIVDPNGRSKFSFARLNNDGNVIELSEKIPISNITLNGIHYWRDANDFFDSGKKTIDDFYNNSEKKYPETYISITYNYLISDGKKIQTYYMDKNTFFSLGTPEELDLNKKYL